MQLEPMLAQCVLPLFKSPYGFVRAKACWVAGLFADIGFRDGQSPTGTFVQLFQEVFHLLRDPELPVSLYSLDAWLLQMLNSSECDHVQAQQLLLVSLKLSIVCSMLRLY